MNFKKIALIILSAILVISMCGCGEESINNSKPYKMPNNFKVANNGIVAQNDNYNLLWDGDAATVILQNRKTGTIWSSTPYDYYKGDNADNVYLNNNLASAICVKYFEATTRTVQDLYGYDAVLSGTVYSKRIKNGVRVIFFFDMVEISVPVDFILEKDGLVAKVLVNEITEKNNLVEQISVLPSFASVKNNTDSYLFVPSGSGALMKADDNERNLRIYSEQVYDMDYGYKLLQDKVNTEKVRLPVFGAKSNDNSVLGIIENGAEMAYINATAGDPTIPYSHVCATFDIRSYTQAAMSNTNRTTSIVSKVTDSKVKCDCASVKFIPTDGYATGYNGMAAVYRKYLKSKGYLKDKEEEVNMFVNFLGGTGISESFFGVPYKTLAAITTLDDAYDIIKEVTDKYGSNMVFNLLGYGNGGLDSNYIAGEYKIAKQLGKVKDLAKLQKLTKSADSSLIMDFDLIFYNKSGSGFSTSKSVAETSNSLPAKQYNHSLITRELDSSNVRLLLGRSNLLTAGKNLATKTAKWNIDGVSLSTLSSMAYSDCAEQKYYAKYKMPGDAQKIIKQNKKNNRKFASNNANMYAAVLSDYIFNPPVESSGYFALDADIPFYQMVFKGNVALASSPINLATDMDKTFLTAMATGSSLEFTVAATFRDEFVSSQHSGISGSYYGAVKELMEQYSSLSDKYLKSVNGANITSYSINGKLAHTVFSNGVEVYVNYGDKAIETPLGTVKALSFVYSK